MAILKVGGTQIASSSGSDVTLDNVALGSGVTGGSGLDAVPSSGITCCEMYYLNTTVNNSTGFTITTNYTRHPDSIGTVISDASGIFSFSSTGIYRIDFATYSSYGALARFIEGKIYVTVDNGDDGYIARATGITSRADSGGADDFSGTYCTYIFDVTSTSTHKVKFVISADTSTGFVVSSTTIGQTYWIFTRMGDT